MPNAARALACGYTAGRTSDGDILVCVNVVNPRSIATHAPRSILGGSVVVERPITFPTAPTKRFNLTISWPMLNTSFSAASDTAAHSIPMTTSLT